MKQKQVDQLLLFGSIAGFLLMSISFLLMPLQQLRVIPGVLFWIGLAAGSAGQVILEMRRRAFFASYRYPRQKMQKPRNGLLTFGSNRFANVADIVMVMSMAGLVLALVITQGFGYICFVLVASTSMSLCLHCIFNGRNFFHVMNQDRVQCVLEKKVSNLKKGEKTS